MNSRTKFYWGAVAGPIGYLFLNSTFGSYNPNIIFMVILAFVTGALAVLLYPEPTKEG